MLPIERQRKIKELVEQNKTVKISWLSEELGVSEMTVHRDIKPLIDQGIIVKTFGGISLLENDGHKSEKKTDNNLCVLCHRNVMDRLAYRLILEDGEIENACCAHCGLLRQQQLGERVVQAICYDFLRQTTISTSSAFYVLGTTLNMGCCQPQVLTFELSEHAQQFVKGFAGTVHSFQDALLIVTDQMKNSMACCESSDCT